MKTVAKLGLLGRLAAGRGIFALGCTIAMTGIALAAAPTGVVLSDAPLFTPVAAPGNVLLELSVEYPTALSLANPGGSNFAPASTNYVGYFDPNLCYTYVYDNTISNANYFAEAYTLPSVLTGDNSDYFVASGKATAPNMTCSGKWSGAFLNWASMQTVDPFRWALTGGYRTVDTASVTILKKAWASGDGGEGETPNRYLAASSVSSYTPFNWGSDNFNIRIWGLGTRMQFTGQGTFSGNNGDTSEAPWYGTAITKYSAGSGSPANPIGNTDAAIYSVKLRVKACDNAFDTTYQLGPPNGVSWCTPYGSHYKPEGLIQKYSSPDSAGNPPSIRFAAMGYLNDNSIKRDAGVLRAQMNFLGPISPLPGNPTNANTTPEWDGTTGIFAINPDPADATATTAPNGCATAAAPSTLVPCATYSGVTNYLNGFGEISHAYKTYDPVSELYYAGIRYFKHLGNVPEWSAPFNGTVAATGQETLTATQAFTEADQFPVITSWNDPILYSCQKNYVLGIGDVNTHASGNIPGSGPGVQPQNNSTYEPTMPALVASDVSVDPSNLGNNSGTYAVAATNYVGKMEGLGNIGAVNVPWCCSDDATYLMAGLAYDAHVTDMRPTEFLTNNTNSSGTKASIQTLTTYWLDVEEGDTYRYQNQFWLAAKYGGFVIPGTYTPYQSTIFPLASWSGVTDATQPGQSAPGNAMPNNYYGASNAVAMVTGLNTAFAQIAKSSATTTTGFSTSNYNTTSSNYGTFAINYDPATWSSDMVAYTTTILQGPPSVVQETQLWDSKTVVTGYTNSANTFVPGQFSGSGWNTGRNVVTWNTTTNTGVPFRINTTTPNLGISVLQQANLVKVAGTQISGGATVAYPTPQVQVVNYLRGDQSQETNCPTGIGTTCNTNPIGFRSRTYLQGDTVNAQLAIVGPPINYYTAGNDPGYPAFLTAQASRPVVVYAAANDGMLHAFSGSPTGYFQSGTGGEEIFAYVPSATYAGPDGIATDAGLAALATPAFIHHYYVDSTPIAADVDYVNTNHNQTTTAPTSQNWATLLVGGLGKGGRSYYAIDVTNPQNFTSETAVASAVKWEFSNTLMGYSYGQPLIVKTKKYGWTVILTSGMNSPYDTSGGGGYFFFVNPATGALYEPPVATGAGTTANPAGLAYASALQSSTDGSIDAVYAGDLLGNVWRLDLTGTTGNYPAPKLFATLADNAGNPQPVTTPPSLAVDPTTNTRYVLVGTGRLLSAADLTAATPPPCGPACSQQSYYSMQDGTATAFSAAATPITRASLASLNAPGTFPTTVSVCQVELSSDAIGKGVTLSNTQLGWVYDLGPLNSTVPTCRVNIPSAPGPNGDILFAANVPNGNNVCSPGGTNQTYDIQDSSGQALLETNSYTISATGIQQAGGFVTQVSQIYGQNGGITSAAGNPTGVTSPATSAGSANYNRLNWREVPADD